jgi:hypothetical protein
MTMYLPNHDVRPVGAEVAEFVDDPTLPREVTPRDDTAESTAADDHESS